MFLEISSSEGWKIIDAIKAYPENYHVSDSIQKMFTKIQKDIEKAIEDENLGKNTTKKRRGRKGID